MRKIGSYHQPVMVDEVIRLLITRRDGDFIDATAGGGGHAYEIMTRLEKPGRLLAIDRDAEAISATRERLEEYGSRIRIIRGEFGRLRELATEAGFTKVSGILFDPGVSSHQLDKSERGFSYLQEGPLDLRMDRGSSLTAAEIINHYPVKEIASIIYRYGGEKNSRRIAMAIEAARSQMTISTTSELTDIIREVTNPRFVNKTLSRVFLGLRTVVNDELEQLSRGLAAAFQLLDSGGRLVVIAYHSLEDRLVKVFFRENSAKKTSTGQLITKKPMRPSSAEIKVNTRARSARLRVLEKK